MTVVSFTDYTPVPRFDTVPFTNILVDEGVSEEGPWLQIDTIPMVPLDADPSDPIARSFTTDQATTEHGWYRVSFADDNNNIVRTAPMYHGEPIEWTPSLQDVGSLVLARTRDSNGNILGTFNDKTYPNDEQVRQLIEKAVNNLMPIIGTDIPNELIPEAQAVAAIRTAMYIELTVFANEVAQNRSAYPELKALFDEKSIKLQVAIQAVEEGGDMTDTMGGNSPRYGFPDPTYLYTRPF